MKNLPWAIGSVIVAVLISIVFFGLRYSENVQLSAQPTTNFTAVNAGTLTQNGGVTATSSAASATFLATDFDDEDLIEVSLPVGSVTLTFPASTTFPLDPTPGATRQFSMTNASTTAGQAITIAGGTGTLLRVASSTITAGLKVINPSGVATFTAFRKLNSDIIVFMNPGQ